MHPLPRRFEVALCIIAALAVQNVTAQSPQAIVDGIEERIETHRKGAVGIQLILPDGSEAPAGSIAKATLQRHEFLFGCNLLAFGNQQQGEAAYRERFAQTFNYATLGFYWKFYEPKPGQSQQAKRRTAADWCIARGIQPKGHPLIWFMEPEWVGQSGAGRDEQLLWQRVVNETQQLKGRIDYWDVVNEPTEGLKKAQENSATGLTRAYRRLGTARLIAEATQKVRRANPDAKVIINDYVIDDRFVNVIRDAERSGAQIDAVGLQSHMHTGYWQVAKLWNACNKFAQLGKPIHFTELSILSGRLKNPADSDWSTVVQDWNSTPRGEQIQAAQLYETYRVLFSHPSVEAITWWDFSDTESWMGAPAGLLRKDMTPKPAFNILNELIHKRWHTDSKLQVGNQGIANLRGFYGDYAVTLEANGQRLRGHFKLSKDAKTVRVKLQPN